MSSIHRVIADRPAAMIQDAAGMGAIAVLLVAALYLPALI